MLTDHDDGHVQAVGAELPAYFNSVEVMSVFVDNDQVRRLCGNLRHTIGGPGRFCEGVATTESRSENQSSLGRNDGQNLAPYIRSPRYELCLRQLGHSVVVAQLKIDLYGLSLQCC